MYAAFEIMIDINSYYRHIKIPEHNKVLMFNYSITTRKGASTPLLTSSGFDFSISPLKMEFVCWYIGNHLPFYLAPNSGRPKRALQFPTT